VLNKVLNSCENNKLFFFYFVSNFQIIFSLLKRFDFKLIVKIFC